MGMTLPADVQLTRAFIAVAVGLVFGFWVLSPGLRRGRVSTSAPGIPRARRHSSLVI